MKKILLGTSALCAVATAGPALAQSASEPIKLGLGGYWNSAYGYMVSQSGGTKSTHRTDDINTDAVINIKGSTKFDNGLTAGVSVQIRAENLVPATSNSPTAANSTPDTIKRSYGYIGSDFGQIRIGDDDDARRQKALTAPIAGGGALFGANTPDIAFFNGGPGTNTTMKTISTTKRVSRLAYFSPTIAGFSFAVSYAPGGEKGGIGEANAPTLTPTNGINTVNQAVSGAIGYSGKFADISLDAYAGGSFGHRVIQGLAGTPGVNGNLMTGRNNPSAVAGGAVVGWGPFKFGGAYERLYDRDLPVQVGTVAGAHQSRNTWDVGPEFIAGPFSVSVDWTRGIYGNINGNSSGTQDNVSLATDYVLGPGVSVGASVAWWHWRNPGAVAGSGLNSGTGVSLMTGIALSF
jgi:outer membrane protein OmpU